MDLTESTWAEAGEIDTSLAVLPVGSTEQHGPHAVLGTDMFTAGAVAELGVERATSECVLGPTIPVGIAAEHCHFPGTLWVNDDTFRAYVRETCESLAAHGWNRIIVVNGHGGNVSALRELCGNFTRSEDGYAVSFTWFDAVDPADIAGRAIGMGHGGPVETSVLEQLSDDYVREEEYDRAAVGAAEQWGEWQSGVNLAYDSDEFSDSGVVGDPREGSAELGKALLDQASEALSALITAVEQRELPERN